MSAAVGHEQRYTRARRCPICDGAETDPRGKAKRCIGFLSTDGQYARCSRDENAGALAIEDSTQTYVHRLVGDCRCGGRHSSVAEGPDRGDSAIVARYDYVDETGVVLRQVQRMTPKAFRQCRPDGRGGWIWNVEGVQHVLYRLSQLVAAKLEATVFIVEGESDADNLARLDLLATTNVGGAGKWRPEYSETLRGRHVAILPDNDEPGRRHGDQVARALAGIAASVRVVALPGLPEKGDVSDWLAMGGTVGVLHDLVDKAQPYRAPSLEPETDNKGPELSTAHAAGAETDSTGSRQEGRRGPARRPLSTFAPRAVVYLWPGRLPAGAVVTLEGIPAAGKSTLATEIVACVTSGRPLYGAAPTSPRSALWIGHEEGVETALRPRFDAAGADTSRVYVYRDPPSFPADYRWLTEEIRETDAAIVIVDPIDAYLDFGTHGDSHRNGDVRIRLRGLSVVAEETGATILMVRHWRKAGGVHAVYRSAGSLAYSAIARAMITVGEDPSDPARRTAAWAKMSDAPPPTSIAWAISDGRRVRWIGDDPRSASELMAESDAQAGGRGPSGEASATDAAETWLTEKLSERGEAPAREVLASGLLAGHSSRALRRARERLGIRTRRVGIPGRRGGGEFYWYAVPPRLNKPPTVRSGAAKSDDLTEEGANTTFEAELRGVGLDALDLSASVRGAPKCSAGLDDAEDLIPAEGSRA